MKLRLTAVLTALALALVTIAPSPALARDRRGDGYRGHDGYSNHYRGHRGRGYDNDGDAVAAGVIGLVLGVALGAALSEPSPQRRAGCSNNYQNCGNPAPQGYYDQSYQQQSYAPAPAPYDDRRSAYEQDYGQAAPYADNNPAPVYREGNACVRQAQQWDPYSGQYVWVNLRTPC